MLSATGAGMVDSFDCARRLSTECEFFHPIFFCFPSQNDPVDHDLTFLSPHHARNEEDASLGPALLNRVLEIMFNSAITLPVLQA